MALDVENVLRRISQLMVDERKSNERLTREERACGALVVRVRCVEYVR